MRPARINNNNYRDNIARKNRRRFFIKMLAMLTVIVALGVGLVYLSFFSPLFKITETSINGLKTIKSNDISVIVEAIKAQSFFGKIALKPQLNIIFFDTEYLQSKISSEFKVVEGVEIIKEFPHRLIINIVERTAIGTWCFSGNSSTPSTLLRTGLLTTSCRYFDRFGVTWGRAIRSSGSLLLSIEDLRLSEEKSDKIDSSVLEPIQRAIRGLEDLNIKVKKIEIPPSSTGDFRIYIANGYYLILNNEADILHQIEIFKILLEDKGDIFHPEYVDLSIGGRIYYK